MKTGNFLLKKIRKGMTLLELVIAMSLTSVVFAGAGVALFSINRISQQETKNHVCLSDAKNLSYVIDLIFKSDGREAIVVVDDSNSVGRSSCELLFTVGSINYGFDKNTFGIIDSESGKIEDGNQKYHSSYDMYFSVKRRVDNKFVELVIHYGTDYVSSLSLVERI